MGATSFSAPVGESDLAVHSSPLGGEGVLKRGVIVRHRFFSHACLRSPGPPNLGLSAQFWHEPQSSRVHGPHWPQRCKALSARTRHTRRAAPRVGRAGATRAANRHTPLRLARELHPESKPPPQGSLGERTPECVRPSETDVSRRGGVRGARRGARCGRRREGVGALFLLPSLLTLGTRCAFGAGADSFRLGAGAAMGAAGETSRARCMSRSTSTWHTSEPSLHAQRRRSTYDGTRTRRSGEGRGEGSPKSARGGFGMRGEGGEGGRRGRRWEGRRGALSEAVRGTRRRAGGAVARGRGAVICAVGLGQSCSQGVGSEGGGRRPRQRRGTRPWRGWGGVTCTSSKSPKPVASANMAGKPEFCFHLFRAPLGAPGESVAGLTWMHLRAKQACFLMPALVTAHGTRGASARVALRVLRGRARAELQSPRGHVPAPPNFGLSAQLAHWPQSSPWHPRHSPQRTRFADLSSAASQASMLTAG
jgi:hypothetical protein